MTVAVTLTYFYECDFCSATWLDDTLIEDICPWCEQGPDGITVTEEEADDE